MSGAFTGVYPLPARYPSMDGRDLWIPAQGQTPIEGLPAAEQFPTEGVGRGTHIPNIPRLLAVLAARQRSLPTARAMRCGSVDAGDQMPADRMVGIFGGGGRASGRVAPGAFNPATAQYLSRTREGESDVYRGA